MLLAVVVGCLRRRPPLTSGSGHVGSLLLGEFKQRCSPAQWSSTGSSRFSLDLGRRSHTSMSHRHTLHVQCDRGEISKVKKIGS